MSIKSILESILFEKAAGPGPSFSVYDIIKTLRIIDDAGSIGRGKLSERLGIGGGAIRTLLRRLLEAELILTSRSGCSLTDRGKRLWRRIEEVIPHLSKIGQNELTFAPYNVVVHVRGRGRKVRKGLEQRDAAVRAGAKGAVTLIYRGKRLILPSITDDAEKSFPIAYRQITSLVDLRDEDVAIIACADSLREAEMGALAAAWTLI